MSSRSPIGICHDCGRLFGLTNTQKPIVVRPSHATSTPGKEVNRTSPRRPRGGWHAVAALPARESPVRVDNQPERQVQPLANRPRRLRHLVHPIRLRPAPHDEQAAVVPEEMRKPFLSSREACSRNRKRVASSRGHGTPTPPLARAGRFTGLATLAALALAAHLRRPLP